MKKDKEIKTVELMIRVYCKNKHKTKGVLCEECQSLLDYAKLRREKCPFGDEKTFCSNCKIHCYKKDMKEKIKQVMRYSGPRMMLYHPIVAMSHLAQTIKYKRLAKKEQKQASKKENNK